MPVVSTFHSGIPEIILNDKSGFLVNEEDVDALADSAERNYNSFIFFIILVKIINVENNLIISKKKISAMINICKQKTCSICIGGTLKFGPFTELGYMMIDIFAELGYKATVFNKSIKKILESDLVFLIGDSFHFDDYADLLSGSFANRPKVIIWHLDPLPPPGMDIGFEKNGLKIAKWYHTIKSPMGWYTKFYKRIVPIPVHDQLHKLFYTVFLKSFEKKLRSCRNPLETVEANLAALIMQRYAWFKRRYPEGWIDYVFSSTVTRTEFLNNKGIPAEFVPVGYHHSIGENLNIKRDIDVLFMGHLSTNKRRCEILNILKEKLKKRGINLFCIQRGYYGIRRTKLLNRVRILLNLNQYPWELPGMRFLMGISCGALVVSERTGDTAPYTPGMHFVQAEVDNLAEVILYYLYNENERKKIVDKANKFIKNKLTLRNSVIEIMEKINENQSFQICSL